MLSIIYGLSAVLLILMWLSMRDKKARQKNNERLQSLSYSFLAHYNDYELAVKEYEVLFAGYIADFSYNTLKNKFKGLAESASVETYDQLFLTQDEFYTVDVFLYYYRKNTDDIQRHNNAFIERELVNAKEFFEKATTVSLDDQQRKAILADQDNNLVIGGVGCGKTTTIAGKVKYLVERCNVDPGTILLVSFTQSAVESLLEKVDVRGVTAKTFNSFGLEVLKQTGDKHSIFDEDQFPILIESIFDNLLTDSDYSKVVADFLVSETKPITVVSDIVQNKDARGRQKLLEVIRTFIVLLKSNDSDIPAARARLVGTVQDKWKERNGRFIDIIEPVFKAYEEYRQRSGAMDHYDIIKMVTKLILDGKYQTKFRYIIIDEFQDISKGVYNLIQALKAANPFCKLFAVGDDWQSIRRYAGADLSFFYQFESYFGVAQVSKIETTYRLGRPLISTTSEFMMRNPNQISKSLKSSRNGNTNLNFVYYSTNNEDITEREKGFSEVLADLIDNRILKDVSNVTNFRKSIYLLGRNDFDVEKLYQSNSAYPLKRFIVFDEKVTYLSDKGVLNMKFQSVHKAEALETDIVILLNNDAGDYGFPSPYSDDPILNLFPGNSDYFENGAERRLFYVALTRAKEDTYLMVDKGNRSGFIGELVG